MTTGIRTSELARQGGINLESIRFYEKQGLLPKPPRSVAGYRMFAPDAVRRVRFIKRAQELGFSLKEIKELLALRLDPDTTCGDVRRRAGGNAARRRAENHRPAPDDENPDAPHHSLSRPWYHQRVPDPRKSRSTEPRTPVRVVEPSTAARSLPRGRRF